MSGRRRVCLGAFAGAHGVKGEAKVKAFTQAPDGVCAYGPVETEDRRRRFALEIVRILKPDMLLVRAPEIASREDAAALAGTRFYVDRDALPHTEADEFYLDDLVGLAAFSQSGAPRGRVGAIYNFGAGDLLELRGEPGRRGPLLVPFTREFVPLIDVAAGRIVVADAAFDQEGAPEHG